jgi:hypothetical protein
MNEIHLTGYWGEEPDPQLADRGSLWRLVTITARKAACFDEARILAKRTLQLALVRQTPALTSEREWDKFDIGVRVERIR